LAQVEHFTPWISTREGGEVDLHEFLLRLPHDILVNLLVRLKTHDLRNLAACGLLRYGQSSPQAPNPVEDALRLCARLSGWSRTLPVDSHVAVGYFLRLARQDDMEFHSISASHDPISLFVDSGGSMRACGLEMQDGDNSHGVLQKYLDVAPAGSLGFGHHGHTDCGYGYFRIEEPRVVPAVEGVRMRSVSIGLKHVLALTDEGQVYMWGPFDATPQTSGTSRAPKVPTLVEEVRDLKVRRVAAGAGHSAALTDDGKLFTWLRDDCTWEHERRWRYAVGLGYSLPGLDDFETALYRPKCVQAWTILRPPSIVQSACRPLRA
jgi:hypothetical protein